MGWDQKLNPDQIKVIYDILVDIRRVTEFTFPRHVLYEHTELHVFADASSKAYGAAVYTVNVTHTKSNLLISKARVAPCRKGRLTIPKLESTASLIGARLIKYLTDLHQYKTIYLWSDNSVTWVPNVQGDLPYRCYIFHKITLSSFAPSEEEESCDVTSARHYLRGSYNSNLFEVRKTFFFGSCCTF